jgi:GTP cyclohydrolase II
MYLDYNDEDYAQFLAEKKTVYNSRLRSDDETFFDAMLSKEADLRTTPEGKEIIKIIQSLGNE